jgi:hypothetical protein
MKPREEILAAALILSVWLNFGMGTMLARWVREGVVNHSASKDSELLVQARDGWLWIEVRDGNGDLWFGKAQNITAALDHAALVQQEAEKLSALDALTNPAPGMNKK